MHLIFVFNIYYKMKVIIIGLLLTLCLGVHFERKTTHKHIEDLHKSKWG